LIFFVQKEYEYENFRFKKNLSCEEKLYLLRKYKAKENSPEEKEKRHKQSQLNFQNREIMEQFEYRKFSYDTLTYEMHEKQYKQFLERQKDRPNLTWSDFLDDYVYYYGDDSE